MTTNDVHAWATSARPGAKLTYFQGQRTTLSGKEGLAFSSAMKAHEEGLVFLCQRRGADGWYEYEAHRICQGAARGLEAISRSIHPAHLPEL